MNKTGHLSTHRWREIQEQITIDEDTVSKYYSSDTHEFLKKEQLTEQRPGRPVSTIRNRRKGWSITR